MRLPAGRAAWALLLPVLFACAGPDMAVLRERFDAGRYGECRALLEEYAREDEGNAHLYALEGAVVDLALGEPEKARDRLLFARDRLDELAGRGFFESLAAVFLDDRQLDYEGDDYEHVLVRALLALQELARGGGDALAYAHQVLERQLEIIRAWDGEGRENPKRDYRLVAFGSYLRGIILSEDPLARGEAKRAFARVVELEPGFLYGRRALDRVRHGRHSAPGKGVVHLLALVGRGPFRVEQVVDREAQVWADAMALAQVIWRAEKGDLPLPVVGRVPIPTLAYYRENPTEVHVRVDGGPAGITGVVTDVEATAAAEFAARRRAMVARAILRRAVKILVTEGARSALRRKEKKGESDGERWRRRRDNALVDLVASLAGLVWVGLEGADTRCWNLLPATFQALRLELPAGRHRLTLRAGLGGEARGASQVVDLQVKDGFNTYVVALVPTVAGGPAPLTSRPLPPEKEGIP